jgi:hypothetical protein
MKTFFLMTFVLFGVIQMNDQCGKSAKQTTNMKASEQAPTPIKFNQLPEGISLTTEVQGKPIKNEKGVINSYEITTVVKTLTELNANYEDGKLLDDKSQEIRFFKPLCRGVSQGLEEDQREYEKSQNELAELKKKYTVIVLHCDYRKLM